MSCKTTESRWRIATLSLSPKSVAKPEPRNERPNYNSKPKLMANLKRKTKWQDATRRFFWVAKPDLNNEMADGWQKPDLQNEMADCNPKPLNGGKA